MYKKLKKKEFEEFLKKLEFKEDGKLPFFDHCEKYFEILGCETHLSLSNYINFLTMYLEKYKNEVCLGELNFEEFLNKELTFEVVEESIPVVTAKEVVEKCMRRFGNYLCGAYKSNTDEITVGDILNDIEYFINSIDEEVEDGK